MLSLLDQSWWDQSQTNNVDRQWKRGNALKKADAFIIIKENGLAKLKQQMSKSRGDTVGFLEQLIHVSIRDCS